MFLRVHAAKFPALWATATRDQVLTRNKLIARDMTARHKKKFYIHSLMLRFSPVLLHAFSTMLGYSQLDIMYIILQHIFMFISQEIGPGACCWHVLLSGSGAGHQKLLDVASMACLARRLGGWTPQNYSMLTHVKTGGKKNSTLRATTFGFFILNLEIWIQGSGAAGHVSSTLIFQDKKTKD